MVRFVDFGNGEVVDERTVIEGFLSFSDNNTKLIVDKKAFSKEEEELVTFALKIQEIKGMCTTYKAYKVQ